MIRLSLMAWVFFFLSGTSALLLEFSSRIWLKYHNAAVTSPILILAPLASFSRIGMRYRGIVRFLLPILMNMGVVIALHGTLFAPFNKQGQNVLETLKNIPDVCTSLLSFVLIYSILNIFLVLFDEVARLRSVGIAVTEYWLGRGAWLPLAFAYNDADKNQKKLIMYGCLIPIACCSSIVIEAFILLNLQASRPLLLTVIKVVFGRLFWFIH